MELLLLGGSRNFGLKSSELMPELVSFQLRSLDEFMALLIANTLGSSEIPAGKAED